MKFTKWSKPEQPIYVQEALEQVVEVSAPEEAPTKKKKVTKSK